MDASGLVVAPGFIDVLIHSVSTLLRDGLGVGKGGTPAPAVAGEAHGFPIHGLPGDDERLTS